MDLSPQHVVVNGGSVLTLDLVPGALTHRLGRRTAETFLENLPHSKQDQPGPGRGRGELGRVAKEGRKSFTWIHKDESIEKAECGVFEVRAQGGYLHKQSPTLRRTSKQDAGQGARR